MKYLLRCGAISSLLIACGAAQAAEAPLDFGQLRFALSIPINDGEVHGFGVSCNRGHCRLNVTRLPKASCATPPVKAGWLDTISYTNDEGTLNIAALGADRVQLKFTTFIGTWTANANIIVEYGNNAPKSDSNITRAVKEVTGSLSGTEFVKETVRTERYTFLPGPLTCVLRVSE